MRTRYMIACGIAALSLTAAGCGEETETAEFTVDAPPAAESGEASQEQAGSGNKPRVAVPDGQPPRQLQVRDIREGEGPEAKAGDELTMDYVGVAFSTEEEFDSSYSAGQPFEFTLGEGMVIAGWDEGIEGMKAGGRRELIIPPGQAYGAQGSPPSIGPDETLVFVVDLRSID